MNTVLNTEVFDHTQEPLFLGKNLALQRYDKFRYPVFFELYQKQWGFFWRPEEIPLTTDRTDYFKLTPSEKWVFDSNLKFQTLGDSCLSRSIHSLAQYISNPELEACMNVWAAFENIHSYSYSYLLNNVLGINAPKFFDGILKDKNITGHVDLIRNSFDKILGEDSEKDVKDKIVDCLIATNVMEGLVFYVSFACSFYFAYRGSMTGNGKIIKLIRSDEACHYAITSNILNILQKYPEEGFTENMKSFEEKTIKCYKQAVENIKVWSQYLFSKGDLLGLNAEVLNTYAQWLCDVRLRSLGLPAQYNVATNPIGGWLDSFLDSSKEQTAPQEQAGGAYKIGAADTNLDEEELSKITL